MPYFLNSESLKVLKFFLNDFKTFNVIPLQNNNLLKLILSGNKIIVLFPFNIDFTSCELDTDYFNDGNARFMEFVKKYQPAALEPVTANGQNKLF